MEKWKGKTAIVTGASSGIGDAIARDLVKHGINVVALARRMERLETLKEQLKDEEGKLIPIKCDVSDKISIDTAFKQIENEVGTVQILVNNAGIVHFKMILGDDESIEDTVTNTINTNFLGLVRVARKAYKLMKKSDDYGIIINIGSTAGHNATFDFSLNVYAGTKHAVRAVTESMRLELNKLKDAKIRVCEISPGVVDSEITTGFLNDPEIQKLIGENKTPILKCSDLPQLIMFMLMTPYDVNITELIVRATGGN